MIIFHDNTYFPFARIKSHKRKSTTRMIVHIGHPFPTLLKYRRRRSDHLMPEVRTFRANYCSETIPCIEKLFTGDSREFEVARS